MNNNVEGKLIGFADNNPALPSVKHEHIQSIENLEVEQVQEFIVEATVNNRYFSSRIMAETREQAIQRFLSNCNEQLSVNNTNMSASNSLSSPIGSTTLNSIPASTLAANVQEGIERGRAFGRAFEAAQGHD